eukprot:12918544-Ditylum_brightwellii.AAC.1
MKRTTKLVHSDSLSSKLYRSSTSSSTEDEDSNEGVGNEARGRKTDAFNRARQGLNTVTSASDSESKVSQEIEGSQSSSTKPSNLHEASFSTTTKQSSGEKEEEYNVSDPLGLLSRSELIAAAAALSAAETPEAKRRRNCQIMTQEQRRQERLAANRRSANAARLRREILVDELQKSVVELVKDNAELRKNRDIMRNEITQLQDANETIRRNMKQRQQRKRQCHRQNTQGSAVINTSPATQSVALNATTESASTTAPVDLQTAAIDSETSTAMSTDDSINRAARTNSQQQEMMMHLPPPYVNQQLHQLQQQLHQQQQIFLQH